MVVAEAKHEDWLSSATVFVLSILLAWLAVGLNGIFESIIHCGNESVGLQGSSTSAPFKQQMFSYATLLVENIHLLQLSYLCLNAPSFLPSPRLPAPAALLTLRLHAHMLRIYTWQGPSTLTCQSMQTYHEWCHALISI